MILTFPTVFLSLTSFTCTYFLFGFYKGIFCFSFSSLQFCLIVRPHRNHLFSCIPHILVHSSHRFHSNISCSSLFLSSKRLHPHPHTLSHLSLTHQCHLPFSICALSSSRDGFRECYEKRDSCGLSEA